jgi:hypothetical protein
MRTRCLRGTTPSARTLRPRLKVGPCWAPCHPIKQMHGFDVTEQDPCVRLLTWMADVCFAEAHVAAAGHRVEDSAVQAAVAWELSQFHSKLPAVMLDCLRRMLLCQIFGQLVWVEEEKTSSLCLLSTKG